MTMVPSQSSKQNSEYVFYSNTTTSAMNQVQIVEGLYNNNCFGSEFVLRHMADHEEEDYSSSTRPNTTHQNEPEPEPVSTSKQEEEQEEEEEEEEEEGANNNNNNNNWLQLSIGFHQTAVTTTKNDDRDHHHHAPSSRSGLLELELLPTNWASSRPNLEPSPVVAAAARGLCSSSSLVFEQTTSFSSSSSSYSSMSMSMPSGPTFGGQQQQQQILPHQWAFGPLLPHSMPIMPSSTSFITSSSSYSSSHSSSSSSSSLRPPLGSYNYPPPHHHQYHAPFHFPSPSPSSSGFDQFDVAGPSSHVTVRVVDPPRRPHSGIWFMLQASQNQTKEPFLPQIPKNYLRIKDGRMTVRLLLKYLVSKLKLDSESEIEITCRGQQLLPFLTLQHVRDNIWTPRDHTTSTRALLSDSSTTDHVMVLHYGRSTS